MKISVASGKGGTGKTTISVALAESAPSGVFLLDCDVEEPNSGLFLQKDAGVKKDVTVLIPKVDESLCTACGMCSAFCQFNALACVGKYALVFPELCHSCGGCAIVCPVKAITEVPSVIGEKTVYSVQRKDKSPLHFIEGRLSIGKAMSPPLIRSVKKEAEDTIQNDPSLKNNITIIDCPPGTSCPMGTAVSGCDFTVLVTEPTPFGLHDLKIAVETVRKMSIPFGIIINRSTAGDDRVVRYCEKEGIKILLQVPEDMRIAQGYSRGMSLISSVPEYEKEFQSVLAYIASSVPAKEGL